MPCLEIVAVGTELLLGQLVDTNTARIAAALAAAGIDVYGTHAVGDNRERIAALLRAGLERADGVVTTGGLGPTVDDLTKEAVCDALGLELRLHEPSLRAIEAAFARLGRPMRANNRKQAFMPEGALVLENPHGTAPGFVAFRSDGKFVASMPGVPREMVPMLARLVPWLRERLGVRDVIVTRVIHTVGIGESEVDHRIAELFRRLENPKIAVLAHEYRCDVKIMAKAAGEGEAQAAIEPVLREIEERLSGYVFGYDEQTLAGAVHALLQSRSEMLAVAESCTGGRICALLTDVPGSSRSFAGGVVAYENSVKVGVLGVDEEKIVRAGAVSAEVAAAMALGARERLGATLALSTTGIAGPQGGTPEKPVGLVWFGLADAQGHVRTRSAHFPGDRAAVTSRASIAGLAWLWEHLRGTERSAAGHRRVG